MEVQNLIACLWNCRSLLPKKHELIYWAKTNKVKILLLTETWLHKDFQCRINGFNVVRHDRNDGNGGALIAIEETISFQSLNIIFQNPTIQIVAVKIDIYTILVSYVQPNSRITDSFWTDILKQLHPPIIFTGDFNAHNILWGSQKTNRMGRILSDTMLAHNMVLLNNKESTLVTYPPIIGSILDLTYISQSVQQYVVWELLPFPMGSNHRPTKITFTCKIQNQCMKNKNKTSTLIQFCRQEKIFKA